jgi:acetyl-CoA carboxylase biotin carboxyl carrier protein
MEHLDDILKLLDALAALPFETVEVSTADVTVRVGRGGAVLQPSPQGARADKKSAAASAGAPAAQGKKPVAVASPIIGMFYSSPSPDEAPFVSVGDEVKTGQTLCIVEAMKLMNEIPSPVSGTVVEVLANDGGEVEVGQTLFLVEVAEA